MAVPAGLSSRRPAFTWGARTYVMAIVNVTPDSFSADGRPSPSAAIEHGRRCIDAGADVVDVGGESTRPAAEPVDAAEELRRVLPVVAQLAALNSVPVSIDTAKAAVAGEALAAGASIVNDVTGLRGDGALAGVIAAAGAMVVLMANHRLPDPEATPPVDETVVAATLRRWRHSVALATTAGIAEENVLLDPGLGFGLEPPASLSLLRELPRLRTAGRPLVVGPSRKGFIGWALGGRPVAERLEGTLAAVVAAIAGGADMVRVHDVAEVSRARLVADAIFRPAPSGSVGGVRVAAET